LLGGGRDALALVEDAQLGVGVLALFGLGDGGDEFDAAPAFDDVLGRLALVVELPMPRRIIVGRVEDRLFEKAIIHLRIS
jgi:hypothetical protein